MKKILILFIFIFLLSACNNINMGNLNVLTSAYPVEFIINELYDDNIKTIESIYPDGTDPTILKLSNKQIDDFSNKDIFIYYGLYENESNIAVKLKNNKSRMHIIDSSIGLSSSSDDLCYLDPTNMIMAAKNIKNGLIRLQDNYVIKNDIKLRFDKLNLKLSNLDAEMKAMVDNAPNKTIIIDNNKLSFLSRYGLNVISLDENINEKELEEVRNLIDNGSIRYIYSLNYENENKITNKLINKTNIKRIKLNPLITITDIERKEKIDYFNLINNNINEIKKELYKL